MTKLPVISWLTTCTYNILWQNLFNYRPSTPSAAPPFARPIDCRFATINCIDVSSVHLLLVCPQILVIMNDIKQKKAFLLLWLLLSHFACNSIPCYQITTTTCPCESTIVSSVIQQPPKSSYHGYLLLVVLKNLTGQEVHKWIAIYSNQHFVLVFLYCSSTYSYLFSSSWSLLILHRTTVPQPVLLSRCPLFPFPFYYLDTNSRLFRWPLLKTRSMDSERIDYGYWPP